MSAQRIQCKRTRGWRKPAGAVYVGRPSRWGNPFPVDHEGTQMHCLSINLDGHDATDRAQSSVDLFRRWIFHGKVNELIAEFLPAVPAPPAARIIRRELGGKTLMCWCPVGAPCHADVLLRIANPKKRKH